MDNFERLRAIKHGLLCVIEEEMENVRDADTDELGKAIDMLKDVEKSMYYCTVIKAMNTGYPEHTTTSAESKSASSRRAYLEARVLHQDKAMHLHELEKYVQELTAEVVEMIQDASPEEKQYLEKKMTTLAAKIGQMK